jgi:histidinol-phosphate aminotransferase
LVPNPNSPSGTAVSYTSLGRLAKQLKGPLVIDEAYADFAPINGLFILNRFPNLIITRSFSKYFSLAGIRFGLAIAHPEAIRELLKVKDSYNCDVLSLTAATAAILDQPYYTRVKEKILATKRRLKEALEKLGFIIPLSEANFLWCRHERPVKPVYEQLKERNILVRYMSYEGYGDGLRISIGTDAEIDGLLTAIDEIMR